MCLANIVVKKYYHLYYLQFHYIAEVDNEGIEDSNEVDDYCQAEDVQVGYAYCYILKGHGHVKKLSNTCSKNSSLLIFFAFLASDYSYTLHSVIVYYGFEVTMAIYRMLTLCIVDPVISKALFFCDQKNYSITSQFYFDLRYNDFCVSTLGIVVCCSW